jgi:hypothetical protein
MTPTERQISHKVLLVDDDEAVSPQERHDRDPGTQGVRVIAVPT